MHLLAGDDIDADYARIDDIGGPQTTPHYPRGLGDGRQHSVPALQDQHPRRWPFGSVRGVVAGASGRHRGRSFAINTRTSPTSCPPLLDVSGVERPAERARPARCVRCRERACAISVRPTPAAPTAHTEQIYEMNGHRGYYRDGWEVVTLHQPMTPFTDEEWELYHLHDDPNELRDLRAEHPDKLRELADAWETAAWAEQIYPLDEGTFIKYLQRPPRSDVFRQSVTIYPGTPTLERWRSVQLIWYRGVTVTVALDFEPGDQGYLVAHGDQGAGYGALRHRRRVALRPQRRARDSTREVSGGPAGRGRARDRARVDGAGPDHMGRAAPDRRRGTGRDAEGFAMLFGMAPFEGIDVGIDRRSPVSWSIYERFGPFPFTGTLRWVRYEPGDARTGCPRLDDRHAARDGSPSLSDGAGPSPDAGVAAEAVLADLDERRARDPDVHGARLFGLVYPTGHATSSRSCSPRSTGATCSTTRSTRSSSPRSRASKPRSSR